MPRYRLVWLEIAEAQYQALSPEARMVVDQRLAGLLDNPSSAKDAIYERRADQWSIPLPGRACLVYAVVTEPATLIVERVVRLAPAHIRVPRALWSVPRALRAWVGRRWFWPRG